jgi:hypothetical protein
MSVRRVMRLKARPLIRALKALRRAGERMPSVSTGGYRVSLQRDTGRLYARSRGRYLGSVGASGVYRPARASTAVDRASIQVLIEDPLNVARGAAMLSEEPRCFVCGRPLSQEDIHRGIGPKCWEKGEFWRLEKEASVGVRKSGRMKPVRSSKTKIRRHSHG